MNETTGDTERGSAREALRERRGSRWSQIRREMAANFSSEDYETRQRHLDAWAAYIEGLEVDRAALDAACADVERAANDAAYWEDACQKARKERDAARAEGRREGMEEAARIADACFRPSNIPREIADFIRRASDTDRREEP